MAPQGKIPGDGKHAGFVLYCREWLTDGRVRMLTDAQRGIYLDLLCHQWLDGSLPDDAKALGRIVQSRPGNVQTVLDGFFPAGQDGRRRNLNLEVIRDELEGRAAKAKAAANARWNGGRA